MSEIKITEDVIISIVDIAIADVEGFSGISTSISDPFGKKKDKKIKIVINNNLVDIMLNVIVYFEYNIIRVCENIQKIIKEQVENLTGLKVNNIDVNVVGIEHNKK